MKKVRIYRLGIAVLLMVVLVLTASPVYADTPDPDSPPTITQINVYRNLLETGDRLDIYYANIPYATLPDQPVTETFIWSLIDTDDVTVLGTTIGYAYHDDGFGYNVYSLYFSAADIAALGMVWLTEYGIRLTGNPAVFDTPPVYNYAVGIGDYSPLTVQAEVQAALAARILELAADLDTKWGLTPTTSLLTQNEATTTLSIFGEAFFRGAIHGVQAMAPYAFSIVIRPIDVGERTWNTTYTGNLTGQWSGTWVETAREAGGALFGTSYDLLTVILMLVLCGGLLLGNIMLTGDAWNGLVDVAFFGVIGARLAMFDFGILLLVAALCWIYIGAKIWFGLIR